MPEPARSVDALNRELFLRFRTLFFLGGKSPAGEIFLLSMKWEGGPVIPAWCDRDNAEVAAKKYADVKAEILEINEDEFDAATKGLNPLWKRIQLLRSFTTKEERDAFVRESEQMKAAGNESVQMEFEAAGKEPKEKGIWGWLRRLVSSWSS